MSNATQYQFDLQEIAKLLIQKQGIKEGRWSIGVAFSLAAAQAGPSPDRVRPTMMVSVDKLVLSRADGDAPEVLTVDASTIP